MTYGQIRLQLTQEYPGVDIQLLDGWIQERYTEILDALSWKRQEAESVIQAPDSYATGTLTVSRGSTVVTGAGTTFTAAMTGRMIRVASLESYYQFTYVSPTSGTLDRAYEEADGTGLSYRIDQAVYTVSADARVITQVRPLHDRLAPLELVTTGELNRRDTQRGTYGNPRCVAPTFDSFSDPPVLQLEFWPIPSSPSSIGSTLAWAVTYQFEAAAINPRQTGVSLLPWVRPAALKEGVRANILRYLKDWNGGQTFEKRFDELVMQMAKINALQRGPQKIRLAPNLRRNTHGTYRSGPRHQGYTG